MRSVAGAPSGDDDANPVDRDDADRDTEVSASRVAFALAFPLMGAAVMTGGVFTGVTPRIYAAIAGLLGLGLGLLVVRVRSALVSNVLTVVGNNKVFADNVQNFSAEPFRRVDCVAKVANSVDVMDAMARLRPVIAAIPNVKASPAPDIEILQFTPEGPLLCVRPYTHTDHYWQVYFDTNKAIVTTFGAAGYPVPETPMAHRTV